MKIRLSLAELDARIELERAQLRRAMREQRRELALATARHLDALHLERQLLVALEHDVQFTGTHAGQQPALRPQD